VTQASAGLKSQCAADIYVRRPSGTIMLIQTKGNPPVPLDSRVGWRPTTLAVCEALLADKATPTASSIIEATGISMGSATTVLKFLERGGHLKSAIARGPGSGRQIVDRDALLDAYAAAAERLRAPTSIQVGVLWRDLIAEVIETVVRHEFGVAEGLFEALGLDRSVFRGEGRSETCPR
jgi:hypothetical protein